MFRPLIIFILILCFFAFCNIKEKRSYIEKCTYLKRDSLQILKGTLNISSKGDFVFENFTNHNIWQRKTHIIPCSEQLKDYIIRSYDSFLYLKNLDDDFWVSIEGVYVDSDTLNIPEFIFCSVSLIDEQEAKTSKPHALHVFEKD